VSSENEAVVLGMWDDYDREGLPGILRWAADDAIGRPRSSSQSVFRSTAEYRADMERALAEGILLADAGLPGRATEASMAMHGAEDVA
jgi:hypothetical protein